MDIIEKSVSNETTVNETTAAKLVNAAENAPLPAPAETTAQMEAAEASVSSTPIPKAGYLTEIPVDALMPAKGQARTEWDSKELQCLADSIAAQGVLQPLIARVTVKSDTGESGVDGKRNYELIAGERRLRAAQLAGLTEVPVVVREMDDEQAVLAGLVENLQRANLTPLEEGAAFEKALALPNFSYRTLSTKLGLNGISKGYVEERVRAHRSDPDIRRMIQKRPDTLTHARVISAMTDAKARATAIRSTLDGASLKAIRLLAKSAEPVAELTIIATAENADITGEQETQETSGHPDNAETASTATTTSEGTKDTDANEPQSDPASDFVSSIAQHSASTDAVVEFDEVTSYGRTDDDDGIAAMRYRVPTAEEIAENERQADEAATRTMYAFIERMGHFQECIEYAEIPDNDDNLAELRAAMEEFDQVFRTFWENVFTA